MTSSNCFEIITPKGKRLITEGQLGAGSYGYVLKVCDEDGVASAIKIVPTLVGDVDGELTYANKLVTRETLFHRYNALTNHPFVVQTFEAWQRFEQKKEEYVSWRDKQIDTFGIKEWDCATTTIKNIRQKDARVMLSYFHLKYYPNGSLDSWLDNNATNFHKLYYQRVAFSRDILTGVEFLHSKGLIHRDLTPTNILLDDTGDGNLKAVISDFGTIISCGSDLRLNTTRQVHTSRIGTELYAAREVLGSKYDKTCDLYSIGVILLRMHFNFDSVMYLRDAILEIENNDILNTLLGGSVNTYNGKFWLEIIKKQLSKPKLRIGCTELLQFLDQEHIGYGPQQTTGSEIKQPLIFTNTVLQCRNVAGISSEERLQLYFSNVRRSAGGPVKQVTLRKEHDWASVEFHNPKDASSACQQKHHVIEGNSLYVSWLPPVSHYCIFIPNVPELIDREKLANFMESNSGCVVIDIKVTENMQGALVTFDKQFDKARLEKSVETETFRGQILHLQDVHHPDAVVMRGLPSDIKNDDDRIVLEIESYLQSLNLGTVNSCVRHMYVKQSGEAVLVFEDYHAVNALPQKMPLRVGAVSMQPYVDSLGIFFPKDKLIIQDGTEQTYLLSARDAECLKSNKAKTLVWEQLSIEGLYCEWKIENECLILWAARPLVEQIRQVITGILDKDNLRLDKEQQSYAKSDKFKQFLAEIQQQNKHCKVIIDDEQMLLEGISQEVAEVKLSIEKQIESCAMYERVLVHGKGLVQFLRAPWCFQARTAIMMNSHPEITFIPDSQECFMLGRGPKGALQLFEKELNTLLALIKTEQLTVDRPGMAEYFRQNQGKVKLREIMLVSETIVILQDDDKQIVRSGTTEDTSLLMDDSIFFQGQFRNLSIRVFFGDITMIRAEALVNAANDMLLHSGGLAMVISKAGGSSIQHDSDEILRKHGGRLKVGEAVLTGAGDIRFVKFIIHVVGPSYKDGKSGEEAALRLAVQNVVLQANKRAIRSLAIPTISTGVFGYPAKQAIEIIVDTMLKATTQSETSLKEIIFFDINPQNIDFIKHALQQHGNVQAILKDTVLTFNVYGEASKVATAKTLLKTACDEICERLTLTDESVTSLTKKQVNDIMARAEVRYCVTAQVDCSKGTITIDGIKAREFYTNLKTEYLAEIKLASFITQHVQWYAKEDEKWTPLDCAISAAVENAYTKTKGGIVKLKEIPDCTADFTRMCIARGSGPQQIKRRLKHDTIPLEWENNGTMKVILHPTCAEYKKVATAVQLTSGLITIEMIERVEVPHRYNQYHAEKLAMNALLGRDCERWLFHGTKEENVDAICQTGLNRSLSGQNAVVYGKGSYFSRDFSYSAQQTYGPRTVFYCQVLVGDVIKGDQSMTVPPYKPGSTTVRFDCTVENENNPGIFVVYSDNHSYPSYLITYKR